MNYNRYYISSCSTTTTRYKLRPHNVFIFPTVDMSSHVTEPRPNQIKNNGFKQALINMIITLNYTTSY